MWLSINIFKKKKKKKKKSKLRDIKVGFVLWIDYENYIGH